MTHKPLIVPPVRGLRERQRADGSVRLWWEPTPAARALGFQPVELDERRLTWSRRQAERLNAEFAAARAAGARRAPRPGGRTIEDLVEDFLRSRRFSERAPATQASYRTFFRMIVAKWGSHPVSQFDQRVIETWYEALLGTGKRTQAAALIRHFSILFSHAERIGWRHKGSNPCFRAGLNIAPPRQRVASWGELDALVAAADRSGFSAVGTAILLSALQGQRQTDVLAARIADITPHVVVLPETGERAELWVWSLTRSKRGTAGAMQLHPDIADRVRAERARQIDAGGAFLLVDPVTAQPYASNTGLFHKRWAAVRAAAAARLASVADLQFRDLRRTFAVLARAGGASKDDTADVLGNSAAVNPRLGQTYMPPQFWTARRAVLAVQRPPRNRSKKSG